MRDNTRIIRPTLTDAERQQRLARIKQAAAELIRAADKKGKENETE